ncbi:MAG TPA: hypothetical protein VFI49_14780 [Rudaea sp.]|nr:hypothetical protein [Rudaea sp.]
MAQTQTFTFNASLSANDGAGISVGNQVTLTLTVTNAGPGRGTGQAQVAIPSVFQYNGEAGCNNSTVTAPDGDTFYFDWNSIPDNTDLQLAANASVACSILLTLKTQPAGAVSAVATILPTASDPNPGNASHQFNIITATGADLAVTASINVSTISQGQSTTVHLQAINASNLAAPNTVVAIDVPPQLQLTTASCNLSLVNGQQRWLLGAFAPGAAATCDLQVLANNTTSQPVSVIATIFSDLPDPILVNNSSGVAISVTPAVLADLAVALSANGAQQTYAINSPVSLNLSVSLLGTGQAPTGVVASFELPAQGLLNNLKATCGSIGATAMTFAWNVANLVKGQPQNCTITGNVASVATPIAITAGVSGAQTDPELGNNTANVVLQTYAPPDALIDVPTTKNSTNTALSSDGKAAVFESRQTDLVGNNTNPNGQDIFRVVKGGQIVRENIDASGKQLVGTSSLPAFSANGQAVVFQYSAAVPGASTQSVHAPSAAGDQVGIMMGGPPAQPKHQLDSGIGGAAPNGTSGGASVSADGHKAVFCSSASNLVVGDTNNAQDVFLVDPLNPAQATQRISVDSTGAQLPGDSCEPEISEDGNKVVFSTSAPSLYGTAARQIVRKNLVSGKLELISAASGLPAQGANADSSQPAVSLNSSTIAFVSKATNLDNRGAVAAGGQVFASVAGNGSDGQARTATRAQPTGAPALNGPSQSPAVTCDGSTVVFQSSATNLPGAVAGQQGMFVYAPDSSEVKAAGNPGAVSNANPSASCDGTALAFDSNQAQPNSNSTNSNVFAQAAPTLTLDGSYSGQWDDPTQVPSGPGHGLVLDVITDGSGVPRNLVLTWFAFQGGRSTWVQGISAAPQPGTGADAGLLVVNFPQVVIAQGKSFPLGEPARTFQNWGTITLKFAGNSTGVMLWTSTLAGFNSGSMQLSHFAYTDLPTADPAGAKVRACYAGNWYSPGEVGHGFELNITTQGATRLLVADWFAFDPAGKPIWLAGTGTIGSGNTVQTTLYQISGSGAQFPPLFDHTKLNYLPAWGTATFTFTDSLHAHVAWNSPVAGYGSGQRDLTPVFGLVGRQCD